MKVSVKVPATTANLGPGFDCLGMALPIYNTITVEETVLPGTGIEINIIDETNEMDIISIPTDDNNIVYKTHTNPPRPASAKATPCASWPKAWARRSPHRAVASSSAHGCPSPPTYGSRVRAHRRSRPTHLPHRPTIVPAPDRDNPYSCLASSHTRYGPNGSKAHSGRDRRNGKRQ